MMMNEHGKPGTAQRLLHDTKTRLTPDELQHMLDEELDKPAEEIDAELVKELLDRLETAPPVQDQPNAWQDLVSRLPRNSSRTAFPVLARIAAVLLLLAGLTLMTFRQADAFNWNFFRQLILPMADHFLVYSDVPAEQTTETVSRNPAAPLPEKLTESRFFSDPADAPEKLQGYPVRPRGLPERYTYLHGEMYTDDNTTTLTHVYASDSGVCLFTATILSNSGISSVSLYGKTPEAVKEMTLCGVPVFFYHEGEKGTPSAIWIVDTMQYGLVGDLSEDEISFIITSTLQSEPMEE